MIPYPVRTWIQEPDTPSPVTSQIACLNGEMGWRNPPPGDMWPPLEVIIVGEKVLAQVNIQCQRSGVYRSSWRVDRWGLYRADV